jgi:hypothetical protein
MSCFIKKIFLGKSDEQVHRQFVRFGKGIYPGRAAFSLRKSDKIKLGGSFELGNDFVNFCAEFGCVFSGIIVSKNELPGLKGRRKSGLWEYNVENLSSEKINDISNSVYTMLLDAQGPGILLKMKKKLPKPGKSGNSKIDDKFCQLELDLKYWPKLAEFFMLPECKKASIKHEYQITDIVIPEGEKDFSKIRELARRKGRVIRKISVDGKEAEEVKEFEA